VPLFFSGFVAGIRPISGGEMWVDVCRKAEERNLPQSDAKWLKASLRPIRMAASRPGLGDCRGPLFGNKSPYPDARRFLQRSNLYAPVVDEQVGLILRTQKFF
jgi:hypothetical protein